MTKRPMTTKAQAAEAVTGASPNNPMTGQTGEKVIGVQKLIAVFKNAALAGKFLRTDYP